MALVPIPGPPPSDAGAAVPSLRSLGTTSTQAAAGNDSRFGTPSNAVTIAAPSKIPLADGSGVIDVNWLLGGHRSVADNTARDAIPAANRLEGMTAWNIATGVEYRLVGGILNGNWTQEPYTNVQNAGSGVTQRPTLNFSTGLTATDNGGSSRTDITVDQSFSPTWTGTHAFNGDVTIGNASSDELTLTSTVTGDITLKKELSHSISVTNSTTSGVAGGALSLIAASATAGNADGGTVNIQPGAKSGSGSDGDVNIGTVQSDFVNIGSITTTNQLRLNAKTYARTFCGIYEVSDTTGANIGLQLDTHLGSVILNLGNASLGRVSFLGAIGSGTATNTINFLTGEDHVLHVNAGVGGAGTDFTIEGADGDATHNGGDLFFYAGDAGAGNANGGNITLDAGAKTGSGTDGVLNLGTTVGTVSIGKTTTKTTITPPITQPVGSDIASAGTISPTAPIHHVTGTTTISTINLPYTGFTGRITLIPDGLWDWDTGGNIAVAGAAVVGQAIDFIYDGTEWSPEFTQAGGGTTWTVTSVKTGTYTAAVAETVRVDPSGGGFTVNLPTASGIAGQQLKIKNVTSSTNTVTIDGNSTETIDGSTTYLMTVGYECVVLESDGTNWMIV